MRRPTIAFAETPPERRGARGFAWGLIRGLGVAAAGVLLVLLLLWIALP